MVRRVARPIGDNRFTGRMITEDGTNILEVEAIQDQRPMNNLQLVAEIAASGSESSEVSILAMEPKGPGFYKLNIPDDIVSPAIIVRDTKTARVAAQIPPIGRIVREYSSSGADFEVLREIADITGGKIVMLDDLKKSGLPETEAITGTRLELWSWLLLAATGIVLLQWLMKK